MAMEENNTVHSLATFLKTHGESVLNGTSKLCLTTSCLSQLCRAFSLLSTDHPESDSFKVLPCNAGSELLQELLFLHDIVQKVVKLKLVTSPRTVEGGIVMSRFKSLRHLELQRVPPHLIGGIGNIAAQLETLGAHRCLSCAQSLMNLSGDVPWTALTTLRLSQNHLHIFEGKHYSESAPHLKNLDLSHNQIHALDISGLGSLVCVDLSFNFIAKIPTLHRRSSFLYLTHLSMRNNLLEDLQGLEVLTALKVLDLGFNMMSEFGVLEPLANLMQLDKLTLEGNPISLHSDYRNGVAAHIAKTVMLDGKFDVHSDRMIVLATPLMGDDVVPVQPYYEEASGSGSRASIKTPKSRQPIIGDPSGNLHESLLSSSLKAANFKKELEERKKLGGESWLVTAANDLMLPNAQSTPYEPRARPKEIQPTRKESRQSDDCIVVSEENSCAKSLDALTLTAEDVETQPRGALMTTSQTESAGDLIDEELGPPVLAGESDKEESPTILDDTETLNDSIYLSTADTTLQTPSIPRPESFSNLSRSADSESSSVVCRVEQDASVWTRLKDARRQEVEYDVQHSIDTDSKMHLDLVVFEKSEDFVAAFKAHIVHGGRSFEGFVVLSTTRLYLTGLKVPQDGIHWTVCLNSFTRVTVQLGAQGLILQTNEDTESKWALVYVGDTSWCGQLAQNLSLHLPAAVLGRSEVSQTDLLASLQLDDHPLRCYAQGYWALIDDTGATPASKQYLCVAVAAEEIVVVRESHVEPEKVKFTEVCAQTVTALSSVSVDERNPCIANLIFTDESSNRDQVWYFEAASVGSLLIFIESLKQPWQDIFDVELPLSYIPLFEDDS